MSIHDEHCLNCFNLICSFDKCGIVKCKHCHISLHSCKVDEHVELICRRAPVKCPNNVNGCSLILIRERIPSHLPICVASVVVCFRDRCRKLNTNECKLQLKHMGKRKEFLPIREEDDLEIQLTCYDQNLIVDSYHSSRTKRVKQRDPLHPAHPLIPLRNMPYDVTTTIEGLEDSSEDEMREKREKLKKSRMVFANCYMCQIDPAVQHLHTLGNGADIEKLKKKRRTPQVFDEFHKQLNLKVSIAIENVPESSLKSVNTSEIKKGGTLYTMKCLKTVRRTEYGDHGLSQHTQSINLLNEMVLRCPNWERGCTFNASRIQVKGGKLRFHPESATLAFQPSVPLNDNFCLNSSGRTIENLPLWVIQTLGTYLPSSSLYNLSLASKKMRRMVFIGCNRRCYVEPVWHTSTLGSWEQNGFVLKVSSAEPLPTLQWRVPVELSQHFPQCRFFDAVSHNEKLFPVFPNAIEKDIWNDFWMNRAELIDLQENP